MNRGRNTWIVAPFEAGDLALRQAAAQLLVTEFRESWPNAWPTLDCALREVAEALEPGKLAFVVRSGDGHLLGWIGAMAQYAGHVWEVHPLVVRRDHQSSGIGRALLEHLEDEVARRSGLTLWVGTDDEADLTSVANIDLYPNVIQKLLEIRNLKRHPMGFYQRLGFEIVGIVPDANGRGKPDLLMAKRVGGGDERV